MAHFHIFTSMLAVAASLFTTHAAETVFFPKGAEHWYPEHLEAMKEPSLFQQTTNKITEQYRFLWLRTFHKPLAVRVRKDAAGITLRIIRLSGAGGYDPGRIEYEESFALTTDQWEGFVKVLDKASFWKMSSAEKDLGGLDGSQWILEGQAGGTYHVVDRWTPSVDSDKRHSDDFVSCCRYLLKLSKQEIPKKDDY